MKYVIKEKECDDTQAVDLSLYGGYLIIPNKFVDQPENVRLQEKRIINKRPSIEEITVEKYEINWQRVLHQQTFSKGITFETTLKSKRLFFGIIYPSGRIKHIEVYRIDKTFRTLTIFTTDILVRYVTVKNL